MITTNSADTTAAPADTQGDGSSLDDSGGSCAATLDAAPAWAFEEVELRKPSPQARAALTGRYRSDELGTVWTLSLSNGALVMTGPVFDQPAELETAIEDEYCITKYGATIRFTRDPRGTVTGFEFGIDSMRGVRFDQIP